MAEAEVRLFAGPSAHGVDPRLLEAPGLAVLPPARRGDIRRLVDASARPGAIVLADGVFESVPAVSHAELCAALDAGWRVWGVSSLGAIRAWELRGEGMRGFGWVYAQFARHADFTDDELCVLHFPEPPYFAVSEALVNLRHALEQRGAALGLDEARGAAAIAELKTLWFGDRTPERMAQALAAAGADAAQVHGLLAWLAQHRVKTIDLATLLAQQPWRVSGG